MFAVRWFLLTFVIAALGNSSLASLCAADSPQRPNVLILFADDQRADTLGAFGHPVVQTPNLDQIARNGFRFTRAYCMGAMGGAVCVPSRAMLNSGRTLFRVKSDLAGAQTMPESFRKAGYATFGTGKWHNRQPSFLRSFETGRAVFFGGMCDHTKVPLVDTTADGQVINKRVGKKFSNTLFADAAVDFLENHKDERPFYAYVAFTAPHDPRQAPEDYLAKYDPAQIPLPVNFKPQHPFFNGWMTGRDECLAGWPRTPEVIREQLSEYYALISHMDHEIGRILATLRDTGKDKNTIIVYAADHGLALGSHGLLGKQSLYEHSMNAPLVISGPGIPAEKSSDSLVYLFDIFPTLSSLTGVELPEGVEGKSLTPIWRGENQSVRDSIYTAFEQSMRSVRNDRWKMIRYPHINKSQLFDLKQDPHELNNLADDPRYSSQIQTMMARLLQWQKEVGDQQPLSSTNPQSAEIDLTGHPRTPDRHQPDWIVKKYFGKPSKE